MILELFISFILLQPTLEMYFLLVISSRYSSYVYTYNIFRWMFDFLLVEKLCHYGGMYVSSL